MPALKHTAVRIAAISIATPMGWLLGASAISLLCDLAYRSDIGRSVLMYGIGGAEQVDVMAIAILLGSLAGAVICPLLAVRWLQRRQSLP